MSFLLESAGTVLLVNCISDINAPAAKDIVDQVKAEIAAKPELQKVAVQLHGKHMADSLALKILGPLSLSLRKQTKGFYLVQPPKSLNSFIRDLGMENIMNPCENMLEMENAKVAPPPQSGTLDVNFVNPFIDGTVNTLKVQCSVECRPLKLTLKSNMDPIDTDIAGVIGLTATAFTGSISICFPEKFFLALMSKMLGEECKEINKDLEDGAGELLNIIFGFAKKVLNEKGYAIEKALPSIVRGKNVSIKHISSTPTVVLPFESDEGKFFIEIGTEAAK